MNVPRPGARRRQMSEINVVPYIDVMLVLLVIFMVTAPLLKQGVDIELPRAAAEPVEDQSARAVVVSVDARGDYHLRVGDRPEEPVTREALVGRVAQRIAQMPDTPVLVRGDADVPYRKVVEALVLVQDAGVEKVGLMTEPPEPER